MANFVTGKVVRIYTDEGGCYIRLKDIPDTPRDGYFRLTRQHANYNSLYSLALSAAVNRHNLSIRTTAEIVPTAHAQVVYMVVDWQ